MGPGSIKASPANFGPWQHPDNGKITVKIAGNATRRRIVAALKTLHDKKMPFISRGDRSGTHLAELKLWQIAGIDVEAEKGGWYKAIGQGMGAALNIASAINAYVLD
jgi:tungstate transport system substrate-binding protein